MNYIIYLLLNKCCQNKDGIVFKYMTHIKEKVGVV